VPYSPDEATTLEEQSRVQYQRLRMLMLTGLTVADARMPERARTFLSHGVGRRLGVLSASLAQIFELFPPSRTASLTQDLATSLQIHLHAFVINVNGVFDSWAWAFVLRHDLLGRLDGRRERVGMFKPQTQQLLPEPLRQYLQSDPIRTWHSRYLKGYRDALAHRIPLYIPSAVYSPQDVERHRQLEAERAEAIRQHDWNRFDALSAEQDTLGSACYHFLHDYSPEEDARPVQLHPQVLADSATVVEFGERFYAPVGDSCMTVTLQGQTTPKAIP
jgi:hypothetical protein